MAGKDPKDMTAAELLRWAAKDITENFLGSIEAIDCIRKTVGSKEKMSYGVDLANALEVVADKIDAEIDDAVTSSQKLMKAVKRIIASGTDWPEPMEGEVFRGWLKRCFIPRPLDETGEPVQFNDSDIDWDDTDECLAPGAQWNATAVDNRGRLIATVDNRIIAVAKTDESGRVKRRDPEVLGADGLPVKEGETAWDMASGLEIVVSRIAKDEGGNVIVCANGDICELQFAPKNIAHTPPDTQERIDRDSQKAADAYWGCIDVSCEECPAKIDGKNLYTRFGTRSCVQAQILDLLRRQRELDARKGGAE